MLREVPLSDEESSFVQPIKRVTQATTATIRRLFKYIDPPFASQLINPSPGKVGLLREIFMNGGEFFDGVWRGSPRSPRLRHSSKLLAYEAHLG